MATIKATASPNISKVYISNKEAEIGDSVILKARYVEGYTFVKWSDGDTNNPRTIVVNGNAEYVAEYRKNLYENYLERYKAYIKDQNNLIDVPKAFVDVLSFTIRNDLLAKSKSQIECKTIPTNVEDGDLIVVYDARANILYKGIINSIGDTTINASQMQSFYSGNWIYNVPSGSTIEAQLLSILNTYSQGKLNGVSYIDTQVATRLGGITNSCTPSITGSLLSKSSLTIMDFETFIYDMYKEYGIIFDFTIQYSGTNTCQIKLPNYTSLKISDNNNAISDIKSTRQIDEVNKLVIFSSSGSYRQTYLVTDNGIEVASSSTGNRYNITNTKIIKSDDSFSNILLSNLSDNQYNHKITFNLFVNNSIYDFNDLHLGMPIELWNGDKFYNTILTGIELSKGESENISVVKCTCGKVRTNLTSKINLGVLNA